MAKTYKPGEKYMVFGDVLPGWQPVLAEIFVITEEAGRLIGMKLPYKVNGAGSLCGRIENGLGVWAHPTNLLTEDEFKSRGLAKQSAFMPNIQPRELKELVFDEETYQVVLPVVESELVSEPLSEPPQKLVPESAPITKPKAKLGSAK